MCDKSGYTVKMSTQADENENLTSKRYIANSGGANSGI